MPKSLLLHAGSFKVNLIFKQRASVIVLPFSMAKSELAKDSQKFTAILHSSILWPNSIQIVVFNDNENKRHNHKSTR